MLTFYSAAKKRYFWGFDEFLASLTCSFLNSEIKNLVCSKRNPTKCSIIISLKLDHLKSRPFFDETGDFVVFSCFGDVIVYSLECIF